MKVLFDADEIYHYGIFGGFGAFTRKLGKELVKRGVEVDVHLSRSCLAQTPGERIVLDGMNVWTLPRMRSKLFHGWCLRSDADVIHSQCGPVDTFFTFQSNPDLPKVVTVQDLRTVEERTYLTSIGAEGYCIEFGKAPLWMKHKEMLTWGCLKRNIFAADVVAYQAGLLAPKIRSIYGFNGDLRFLPNFVDIPEESALKKSSKPSVVWLGRLDPVKHPVLMCCVAAKVPDVDFYVLGNARQKAEDDLIKNSFRNVANLHFLGQQDGAVKEEILSKAWILINTSHYECLPVSFLEALAHKCALLSTRNPDGYTDSFGYFDKSNSRDGLVYGLNLLLKDDAWRAKGEAGYKFVKRVHSTEQGVMNHIRLYKELI